MSERDAVRARLVIATHLQDAANDLDRDRRFAPLLREAADALEDADAAIMSLQLAYDLSKTKRP